MKDGLNSRTWQLQAIQPPLECSSPLWWDCPFHQSLYLYLGSGSERNDMRFKSPNSGPDRVQYRIGGGEWQSVTRLNIATFGSMVTATFNNGQGDQRNLENHFMMFCVKKSVTRK